ADTRQSAIETILLEPSDGIIAGVVLREDLGQEDPQSDRRGVEALAPEMMAAAARRFDALTREQLKKRESCVVLELIAYRIELAPDGAGGRLSHDDLLGRGNRWPQRTTNVPRRGGRHLFKSSLVLSAASRVTLSECHSSRTPCFLRRPESVTAPGK